MENCIFCKKLREGSEIIYQDNYFFAQFDRFPVSPGHAEVIPKRHIASFMDMEFVERAQVWDSISEVIEEIDYTDMGELYKEMAENPINEKSREYCMEMLNHMGIMNLPDGYNIGINEGRVAGRTIDHLHIHIIPRYFGDVPDPVGGIRNIIPGKGNYRK